MWQRVTNQSNFRLDNTSVNSWHIMCADILPGEAVNCVWECQIQSKGSCKCYKDWHLQILNKLGREHFHIHFLGRGMSRVDKISSNLGMLSLKLTHGSTNIHVCLCYQNNHLLMDSPAAPKFKTVSRIEVILICNQYTCWFNSKYFTYQETFEVNYRIFDTFIASDNNLR